MELYLDTGDLRELEDALALGVISGVTTNPTLLAAGGPLDYRETIQRFCSLVPGPVSAEVIAMDYREMVVEAREIATWASNVVVKLPMTAEALKALRGLGGNVPTNVTLVFSANQALLAARAGATYVSPFVGRLDDIGHDGMAVVRDAVEIFRRYGLNTKVLAASIRHPLHCIEAAKAGADIASMPHRVLMQMIKHPLPDAGLERFIADWRKAMGERGVLQALAAVGGS